MNYKLFKFKMKVILLKYKKKFLSAFEYEDLRSHNEQIYKTTLISDGVYVAYRKPKRSFKNLVFNIRDFFFMVKVNKLSITEYGMFLYDEREVAFKNIFIKFGNWIFKNLLPGTYFSWSIKSSLKNAIKQMKKKGW